MFLTQICQCLNIFRSLCPYMYLLLCVQGDNQCAVSSHSHSVTQSGVCAFSIHPIHPVICLTPGAQTVQQQEPQHGTISVLCLTETV